MNTAVARLNWEGQVVDGKFPLQKWLGGSEQCDVFRTQLPGQPPQAAAIKLVSPEAGNAERQLSRWQMAATLTHPNLLRVFHAGQCKIGNTPLLYVVMEYAEEDLSQVLPARALSAAEARQMLPPLLDALSYLHSRGLAHGRVKPSNIMAVADQLKLSVDSIRGVTESADQTLPRSAFDAPETARGGMSRAADVWSLGVTLVRCLSQGRQARENYNPVEQGIAQTIPEPFRHIARECLRPDPKARCTLADIREWLRPAVGSPTVSPAAVQPSKRRRSLSLTVWAAIAAVLLVIGIFAMRWATHGKPETPLQTAPQPSASSNVSTRPSTSAPVPAPAHVPAPTHAPTPTHNPAAAAPVAKPPAHSAQASTAESAVVEGASAEGSIVERVIPSIPASARNTIQGKVRVSVRVAVNPAGEVADATLVSPGPSKYFANKALDAARRWKFKPAAGQSASSQWMLRFLFGRSSTEVLPTELPAGTH